MSNIQEFIESYVPVIVVHGNGLLNTKAGLTKQVEKNLGTGVVWYLKAGKKNKNEMLSLTIKDNIIVDLEKD